MKKIAFFSLALLIAAGTYAQTFKVSIDGDDVTNLKYTLVSTDYPMEVDLLIENLSPDSVNTMLKRYEVTVVPGTKNYFCWGECFEPVAAGSMPLWYGADPIKLGQNQEESSGHAYHTHENLPGKSTYLYVVYDADHPDDSVTVEIVFDVPEYVGIKELTEADVQLNASPNPASNVFSITYQLNNYNGNDAKLVLIDLLGKKQGEYSIRNKKGRVEIDAAKYVPGIYFYSLQVDGRLITTKKIIVN